MAVETFKPDKNTKIRNTSAAIAVELIHKREHRVSESALL